MDENPSSTVTSGRSPCRVDEDLAGGLAVRDLAQRAGDLAERVHGVDVGRDAAGCEQVEQLGPVAFREPRGVLA
jgi:hypothetical protein